FRRTGEGVYDMDDLARATQKMRDFVKAHRDAASPSAVIGLGHSNGANIRAAGLFEEPGLVDAAVLMHPLIPFEHEIRGRLARTSILMAAGRRDPICPAPLTERLHAGLVDAGASSDLVWHDGGHEVRPAELEAAAAFLSTWRKA